MKDLIERLEHACEQTAVQAGQDWKGRGERLFTNHVLIMNALVLLLKRQSNEDAQVLG